MEMLNQNNTQNHTQNENNKCRFQILGYPSNLFNHKEPGYNFEIKNCLYYVRPGNKFVPAFPLSSKIEVNGENEIPLYTYLKVFHL